MGGLRLMALFSVHLVAGIAMPVLRLGIWTFGISGIFAYLNPGWVDAAFTQQIFMVWGVCYVARSGLDAAISAMDANA